MGKDFRCITYPSAKKEYQCSVCGKQIYIGEIHCKTVEVYMGIFYSVRTCNECIKGEN
jgi:hypothetical protein